MSGGEAAKGTLLAMLRTSAEAFGDRPALTQKLGGQWQPMRYAELWETARRLARGLAALGIQAGDRVAMVSENSPEWVVCDFGILCAGAVNVAMFPSLPPVQMEQILADSGAWLLIVGSEALLKKALVVRQTMPDLQIITMQGVSPSAEECVLTIEQVLQRGDDYPEAELQARRAAVTVDDLASIVYTSGTSGEQKGVMLSHGNFMANVYQCQQVLHFSPDDVLLSVLPLNHVFERTTACYLPLACGAQVAYAESLRRLRENLTEIRPTILILVPRFFEVLRQAVLDRMQKAPARRQKLFQWALRVGERALPYWLAHKLMPPQLWLQWLVAEWLVLAKLRGALGLDRAKEMVSGAAALALVDNEFFGALGVEVLEGYGLTEAAPVVACNRPGQVKLACVGPPLPGVEVKLGDQDEILVRGGNVMRGYWAKPEATAAALDDAGWLHTGDIGKVDEDGYLSITDRLKDLLVLTSGKNVAPQPIENAVRTSPYVSQAVVLGDRQQYVTALIVPAFDRLKHWAASQNTTLPTSPDEILDDKAVQRLIKDEIERLTPHLADFEKVRDFRLLPEEFTVEGGELTPTLKVKRRVVLQKFSGVIGDMYR